MTHEPPPRAQGSPLDSRVRSKTLQTKTLQNLATEQRLSESLRIDEASALQIAEIINQEDKKVAVAVEKKLAVIAELIERAASSLKAGGRLLYFGAGTSGRLGVLDASECPPTFGTDPHMVQGFMAGGPKAMFEAQEGAEDLETGGAEAVQVAGVSSKDLVIGLAASGRTPYVHGALKEASKRGAATALICTVPSNQVHVSVDLLIDVPVGPEVIAGSTRMKSATAQKMVLNMISTGAMIVLGKVYENVMVDLQLTNEKLAERARRILRMFTDLSDDEALRLLNRAGGHVKTALIMEWTGCDAGEAKKMLDREHGNIRKVLAQDGPASGRS